MFSHICQLPSLLSIAHHLVFPMCPEQLATRNQTNTVILTTIHIFLGVNDVENIQINVGTELNNK